MALTRIWIDKMLALTYAIKAFKVNTYIRKYS